MRTSLRVFLFHVVLTTGTSLECEYCSSNSSTCTGKMDPCLFDENTCVIQLSEDTRDGKMVQKIEKHCGASEICQTSPYHMNMGNGRFLRLALACCQDGTCSKTLPQLIPMENIPNGRRCDACYSWKGACEPKPLNCSGLETFCFEIFSRKYEAEGIKNLIMMGCTTMATCRMINYGETLELEGLDTVVIKAQCKRDISKGTRPAGLILPTFTGLLLLRSLW